MDLDKRKLIVFGSSSDIATEFINNQNEFRYGGWYTDTDTVTIRKTTHFENTAALSGLFVANGNLIFSRGSKFLKELLVRAELRYTGKGEQLN